MDLPFLFSICFVLAVWILGSTENLCGLQRAPSLPRSYRQRSGIPVLNSM